MKKIIKIILSCFLCFLSSAFARQPNYEVNWSTGIITSHAQASFNTNSNGIPVDNIDSNRTTINRGRNEAHKQARSIALENMSNAIMSIRVDSNTRIHDLVESNREFHVQLANILDSQVKEKSQPIDFFSSKSTLSLPLWQIINILPYRFPNDDFPTFDYMPISTTYTSLIVDTRGQNIFPTILPSIFDRNGLEIYNRYFIDIRYGVRAGLVSYVGDEKEAYNHPKAGKHPYFATSMRNISNSPILSDEDIRRIYSSPRTLAELKKCKVIFIIDGGR